MKFIDLFAGIGGIRLGMEQAGHECVAFCERDKFAVKSYKAMHNTEGEKEYGDITTVQDEEWGSYRGTVDVVCGGFPCQAFSVAGKRKGFDDVRGTMFFYLANAVKQIKPRYFLFENVKGLLNHDKGRTFGTILNALDELGYDVEWHLYNSKDYGVPQNRERVYIVGHSRERGRREILPFGRKNEAATREDERGIIRVVDGRNDFGYGSRDVYSADGLCNTLNTMSGGDREPKVLVVNETKGFGFESNNRVYDEKGLAPTLAARDYKDAKKILIKEATKKGYAEATIGDSVNYSIPTSKTRRGRVGKGLANTLDTGCQMGVVVPCLTPDRIVKRQNGRRFKENGETMFTINTVDRHGVYDGLRIRKLTPLECWRLQGFPDEYFYRAQAVNSNSQLYKQAGNSVTVNVVYAVAKHLKE